MFYAALLNSKVFEMEINEGVKVTCGKELQNFKAH